MDKDPRTHLIIGAAMEVHNELGSGFLEAVYQEALEHELTSRGIPFKSQPVVQIKYKGEPLKKTYQPDLIHSGFTCEGWHVMWKLSKPNEPFKLNLWTCKPNKPDKPNRPNKPRLKMTPSKKLKATMDLYCSARVLKAANLRCQHPNWTEERVRQEILDILSDGVETALHSDPPRIRLHS